VKRILLALALAAMILTAPVAVASAKTPTLRLKSTSAGKLLVNSRGDTVYMFTKDGRRKDNCATTNGCLQVWPALTSKGNPTVGAGVKARLVGTIKLSNGKQQVTYGGHPLYTYVGDEGPASTDYVGFRQFGGLWYGVSAAAKSVKG
jgi:predicted lipoprotein with Yx(FWY)xxD motif